METEKRATKKQQQTIGKRLKLKAPERSKAKRQMKGASSKESRRKKDEAVENLQKLNQMLLAVGQSVATENDALKVQLASMTEHTSRIVGKLVRAFGVGVIKEALADESHWLENEDPNYTPC